MSSRRPRQAALDVAVLSGALVLALSPLPVVFGGTVALPALGLGLLAGTVLRCSRAGVAGRLSR